MDFFAIMLSERLARREMESARPGAPVVPAPERGRLLRTIAGLTWRKSRRRAAARPQGERAAEG